jgi:hypothetical protein
MSADRNSMDIIVCESWKMCATNIQDVRWKMKYNIIEVAGVAIVKVEKVFTVSVDN